MPSSTPWAMLRSRIPPDMSSTLSSTPDDGEPYGNVYNLYLQVEDLEGVRAVEELARTLELKTAVVLTSMTAFARQPTW